MVNDGYVAAGAIGEWMAGTSGMVALPTVPLVALPLSVVAEELGLRLDDGDDVSDWDIDMDSYPLAARAGRRLGGLERRSANPGVRPVVLFPMIPALPAMEDRPDREGTILDSVDGGDSDFGDGLVNVYDFEANDPTCDEGSRDGGCECSCEAEIRHLNRKVQKLEDLVRLLIVDAGLAGWEETQRVENPSRKKRVEREEAERTHGRKVAAERSGSEERKRLAKRDEQGRKAEEVRKSQEEAARLQREKVTVAKAALEVSVEECVQATTLEELLLRAARLSEAVKGVKRVEAISTPASEDVDVGAR